MASADRSSPSGRSSPTSWQASKPAFVSRLLLGLVLISGGINNFLVRIPVEHPTPEAEQFLRFLQETGYMLQLVAGTEIAVGITLLSGYFLPLALAVFAPIMLNIILFHVFIQLAGVGAAILAALLYGHLVYLHRERFAGVLSP